eukprot:CAMPEP_0118956366 /NCGR_PEP_ID=MMETSP1169-20130426/61538_1 /TAXON_ID=36882 /ORGANISM="Pyramimonas obovata, Strain CCMP722" /LENGTH=429 /DNA_ID=CAMNT_0006904391 /DNA_START=52 /DNA_END=1338 /DNA_ORIENTATION=-
MVTLFRRMGDGFGSIYCHRRKLPLTWGWLAFLAVFAMPWVNFSFLSPSRSYPGHGKMHRNFSRPGMGHQVSLTDSENLDVKEITLDRDVQLYLDGSFQSKYRAFERTYRVFEYRERVDFHKTFLRVQKETDYLPLKWRAKLKLPRPVQENGQYGLEVWFPRWLKHSNFFTVDPEEATSFYLSFSCTSLKNTQIKRVPGQVMTQVYVQSYVDIISSKYSFWNRTFGSDHFYLCVHDMGTECTLLADMHVKTNSIAIVNTADFDGADARGQVWNNVFQDQKHVQFSPLKDISSVPFLLNRSFTPTHKDFETCKYLLMFVGVFEGRAAREQFFKDVASSNYSDVLVGSRLYGDEYVSAFGRARFCLVIRGLTVWTKRLAEVFLYGCIPVIVADTYSPPLSRVLNWTQFAIFVKEKDVHRIREKLLAIDAMQW